MLEFKHPTMTTSLSALEFFRASIRPKSPVSTNENKSVGSNKKSLSKHRRSNGIEAACVLPSVIFLGTEMFTPAEPKVTEKPEVPEITITLAADDQKMVELLAS